MLSLLRSRDHWPFPWLLYEISLDMFAIVEHWDPSLLSGPERGRFFEEILYRYCSHKGWALSERAGAKTLYGKRPASRFLHEVDCVIDTPAAVIALELKYLTEELGKNELLIFNQKTLDVLASEGRELRSKPLYRIIVSGNLLSPAARRFALQWGILAIEPERLPLLLIHQLAGSFLPNTSFVTPEKQEEIWREIPQLLVPLQLRIKRLSLLLDGEGELLSEHRIDRALHFLQRSCGDYYWDALDKINPGWLEDRYDQLNEYLSLDGPD